jgi:hypothetical protein
MKMSSFSFWQFIYYVVMMANVSVADIGNYLQAGKGCPHSAYTCFAKVSVLPTDQLVALPGDLTSVTERLAL